MREVGRALALDPDNVDALRFLVRLLDDPPAVVPREVEERLEESVIGQIADLVPVQVAAYASFVVLFPLVLWMGVRDWAIAVATSMLVLGAAGAALLTRRTKELGRRALYPSFVVSTLVIGFVASMFGPFVFVPALTTTNTLFYVIQLGRERALHCIVLGCLPIAVPYALEAARVAPPAYRFGGASGAMEILPWMHAMREPATPLFLFLSSVALVVVACVTALRFRESLERAERRVQLHAWQLAKLLPPEAARAPDER
jgi:hypothetical protein